jgi:hypothetical protein
VSLHVCCIPAQRAAKLGDRSRGRVMLPGDDGYDAARQVWNPSHEERPALIAQLTSARDVQAAAGFARQHQLPVSARGGQDYAAYALADGPCFARSRNSKQPTS